MEEALASKKINKRKYKKKNFGGGGGGVGWGL